MGDRLATVDAAEAIAVAEAQRDIVNVAAERGVRHLDARRRAGGWGVCTCGHPIYTHGRTKYSGNIYPTFVACGADGCDCMLWRASDGSSWPYGPAGE